MRKFNKAAVHTDRKKQQKHFRKNKHKQSLTLGGKDGLESGD